MAESGYKINEAIGGYFSLELPYKEEYHKDAIHLNTGRNCLEYILRSRNYKKVHIPYYTCDAILEPFKKLGIDYSFYHIDLNLELAEDIQLDVDEALLYTNYFGLKQSYVKLLAAKYEQHLIVDNTQAFFASHIEGIDTFYTCRKFFGVPDGAYLYTDKKLDMILERDTSYGRMSHLLKRIDLCAEEGFQDFKIADCSLSGQPIRQMSRLTERIMESIDYGEVIKRRRKNFLCLENNLGSSNLIKLRLDEISVPMVYPYLSYNKKLRTILQQNRIYTAKYWQNVQEWCEYCDIEYYLTESMVFLPIDQRYNEEYMSFLIQTIEIDQ